jgi:hypothetical protein
MRRMNGDCMLRERCYEERHAIAREHEFMKMQEKQLVDIQKQQIQQEISRERARGFSLEM